jgi:hypothetical protein
MTRPAIRQALADLSHATNALKWSLDSNGRESDARAMIRQAREALQRLSLEYEGPEHE